MITLIRTQWRALITTRMWWILLVIMMAVVAGMAALIGLALTLAPDSAQATASRPDDLTLAMTVYTMDVSLGYVFPVTLGALHMTGEYRYRTIDTTLLLAPSRSRLILAKAASVVPMGLLYGAAAMVSGLTAGVAALAIGGQPLELGDSQVWRALVLGLVVLCLWMVIGVGFGCSLRNQVAAVVTLLAFTQFIEPLLRVGLGSWSPTQSIQMFLPGAAGEAAVGASFYSTAGVNGLLPWWAGLLVLLGYAMAAGAIGRVTTLRRDIT